MRSFPVALSVLLALAACHPSSTGAADPNASSTAVAAARRPEGARPPGAPDPAPTKGPVGTDPGHAGAGTPLVPAPGHELAAFAEGCFWGSEDTFRHVTGVIATAVGYTGGHTANPSYEDVCTHTTGHAETVLVEFDPNVVRYDQLLAKFWDSHDPTTLNQQGPDYGDQYRSEIFTLSEAQADAARASLTREQTRYDDKITTRIEPLGKFWKAEGYHQQYDERTGRHSCPLPPTRKST